MKFFIAVCSFLFAALAAPAQLVAAQDISIVAAPARVSAGGDAEIVVYFLTLPNEHVYWKNPGEVGFPLSVEWKKIPDGATFGEWRWSTPKSDDLQGLASFVLDRGGRVAIPVKIPANAPAGTVAFEGTASWLVCDDSGCRPRSENFSVAFEIAPAGEKISSKISPDENVFPRRDPAVSATAKARDNFAELSVFVSEKIIPATEFSSARFFPENSKFGADAASVAPEIRRAPDGSATLVFSLQMKPGEKFSAASDVAGVLVFEKNLAFEIVPAEASTPAPVAVESAWNLGFVGLLALAFLGGLILNLMPCVFPVLGLKILHFVGQAGSDRKKIARHGFVFAVGVVLSFWILAAVLAVLRGGGEQLGWGFQLQEPGFVYAMTLLLFVFGLSMSGVFEIGVRATSAGGSLTGKSGYVGSLFSGVLAVVVATPCAAPFLAPALGSALALPLVPSFAVFTAVALGLAAPYVALSCAPALLKFLPKPGAWMETFKQAMAFLLYAPAAYFFWVLIGQVSDATAQRDLAVSFAVVALACWIYGKWGAALWRSGRVRTAGIVVALVLFAGAVGHSFRVIYQKGGSNDWIAWSPAAQAAALDDGKTVYIDFTARWCATCQVNKRVYADADLMEKFSAANVVKMRADWTNKNPEIAAELQKYGRAAVPVNVFLKKGAEPVVLGELFSGPNTVADGLQKIMSDNAE